MFSLAPHHMVLLVDERSRLYERSREDALPPPPPPPPPGGEGQLVMSAPRTLDEVAKPSGSATTKGQWTHRLIPSHRRWIERRHGEVKYHLTQLLSGHGCFRSTYVVQKTDTKQLVSDLPSYSGGCRRTMSSFHCPRFTVGKRRELTRLAKRAIRARAQLLESC
ncbi:unnamed protein product [Trichogramma brassicae]|uniref:Uncharacterized protein n=1 Tax=Trichogramma brassicae TaxID=86971 RepID=A0A6H5IWU1_9HYME|nr:unnamed protein product [Trichogramma brassicae]